MSGASFSLNMGNVTRRMDRAITKAHQTQELAETIGEALVSSTQQRFEDEEDPDGKAWEPSIRAQHEGGKTLNDTAALKNSIGYAASPTAVVIGSNRVYAAIHQLGGEITAKNGKLKFPLPGGGFAQVDKVTIPQRAYLGVSAEDEAEVKATIREFMLQALRG